MEYDPVKQHEYYLEHREQMQAANKRWRLKNKEKVNAQKSLYDKLHPDKVRLRNARYYLKKKMENDNAGK